MMDENGEINKIHLNYRAEYLNTGQWFIRDAYIGPDAAYVIDEDEEHGVTVTLYKDKVLYTLYPESKTGTGTGVEHHWDMEADGVLNEAINLLHLIQGHIYRSDYTLTARRHGKERYETEVFPESRFKPEIAFYFDGERDEKDVRLAYVYEDKYYGTLDVFQGTGDLLFTIYDFSNDFDESIFDISDYEVTIEP